MYSASAMKITFLSKLFLQTLRCSYCYYAFAYVFRCRHAKIGVNNCNVKYEAAGVFCTPGKLRRPIKSFSTRSLTTLRSTTPMATTPTLSTSFVRLITGNAPKTTRATQLITKSTAHLSATSKSVRSSTSKTESTAMTKRTTTPKTTTVLSDTSSAKTTTTTLPPRRYIDNIILGDEGHRENFLSNGRVVVSEIVSLLHTNLLVTLTWQ